MVLRVMLIGPWKSVEEVEENLSLPELVGLLKVQAEEEWADRKFTAALKGIQLPEPENEQVATFEEVKRRAEARLAGISEEQLDFMDMGIDYQG